MDNRVEKIVGAVALSGVVAFIFVILQDSPASTPAAVENLRVPSPAKAPPRASDPLLAVFSKFNADFQGTWDLRITSKADFLLRNVAVNRGCRPQNPPALPLQINFGQVGSLGTYLCDPIEVEIKTSKGNQTFRWDAVTENGISAFRRQENEVVWYVALTNRSFENLSISDVSVNRGNCKVSVMRNFEKDYDGRSLKFGQRYFLLTYCNPLELKVTSSRGTANFSWNY